MKNNKIKRSIVKTNLKLSSLAEDRKNADKAALQAQMGADTLKAEIDKLMTTTNGLSSKQYAHVRTLIKEYEKLNKETVKQIKISEKCSKKEKRVRNSSPAKTAAKVLATGVAAATLVGGAYVAEETGLMDKIIDAITPTTEVTVVIPVNPNKPVENQQPQQEQPQVQQPQVQQPVEEKVLSAGDKINFTSDTPFYQSVEGNETIVANGIHVLTGKFAYTNEAGQVIGVVKAGNITQADNFAEAAGIDTNFAHALFTTETNYPNYADGTAQIPDGVIQPNTLAGAEFARGWVDVDDIPVAE